MLEFSFIFCPLLLFLAYTQNLSGRSRRSRPSLPFLSELQRFFSLSLACSKVNQWKSLQFPGPCVSCLAQAWRTCPCVLCLSSVTIAGSPCSCASVPLSRSTRAAEGPSQTRVIYKASLLEKSSDSAFHSRVVTDSCG